MANLPWTCIGLAGLTCLIGLLVATLLWLVLRRRRSASSAVRRHPTQQHGMQTITDLDSFLAQHPHATVLFHASWCGHCKKLLPTYESVAAQQDTTTLPMAALECDNNDQVVQRYKLRGYPTILKFRNGQQVAEYSGNRTASDLAQFCRA